MLTDIIGYIALMKNNEIVVVTSRAQHRKVFQKEHKTHQREII